VAEEGPVGGSGRLRISHVLRGMRRMVYSSKDSRATALAELKESEHGEPFRVLIGTILSQRTRDENTTRAVENLFSRYTTPGELAAADEAEVRRLVRPSGFYNRKAKNVIAVSKDLMERFGGKVPTAMEDLLSLHSVGRKTANCVLVYAYGVPAIPVDTHVHRISNRLGLVKTKTPEETESALTSSVPRRYWLEVNDLFVRFGQTVCRPIGPKCGECAFRDSCPYYRNVVRPDKHR
jgi:endonuclease III